MKGADMFGPQTEGFFSGLWRSLWDGVKRLKDWVFSLEKPTKTWSVVALCIWGIATLLGGGLREAAFIALCYCAAVWALLTEAPFFADLVIKGGLLADILVTFGATLAMPGSVSLAYAAMFFGIFFTCMRKAFEPLMPRIRLRLKERKAERERKKLESEEQNDSDKPGFADKVKETFGELMPQPLEPAMVG
jgi:hypothetical protein